MLDLAAGHSECHVRAGFWDKFVGFSLGGWGDLIYYGFGGSWR